MTDRNPGGRRLRQWLIEQIHSNLYPGLLWENDEETMFRIPWKHAGKQDYNQEIDASIFKAWAVFKGKFKEGDKAEPATWKTRLRCALNKSPDFEEVTDRSQLDISEPYKVYRIVPEEEQKCKMAAALSSSDVTDMECSPLEIEELIKESSPEDYMGIIRRSHSPPQDTVRTQPQPEWWPSTCLNSVQAMQDSSPAGNFNAAFSQMMITFYYGGKLVGNTLTTHNEGCRISLFQPPLANEMLYGPDSLQNIRFPPVEMIENERQRHVTKKLFAHLERGVLVRANREGIFIKRLCQSRVFWSGMCSQYSSSPNKLDRDAVVKIFDTARFLTGLQLYQEGQCPAPDPIVTLCFGEEFPDANSAKYKLIIVQITQMNCQQVLDAFNARRTNYSSGNLEISDESQNDQMARIFQDLCSYNGQPRPCFRENLPITV
ncbi:interferon regulatory factor 8 [Amia ocellicauda]|uniref:interferon regulatory factor 8 n=1 Tax=Amia ocellicauda TaxID=2972642 RepID=UPI0034642B11